MNLFNEYLKTTQRGSILVCWHFPFLSGTQNCAGAEVSVEDIYQNYIHEFGILWKTKVQNEFNQLIKTIFKNEPRVV